MAQQELGRRGQDPLGFIPVVLIHNRLADSGPSARRQQGLHGEEGIIVVLGKQVMSGQVGQQFLGIGTAIDSEKNFHSKLLEKFQIFPGRVLSSVTQSVSYTHLTLPTNREV